MSGPHFSACIGGRGGVGGAGAVNWSPFDMSGLEVRYPVPFFIEKEEVLKTVNNYKIWKL